MADTGKDFNPILDSETDPGAPARSTLAKRMIDNPIAAMQGDQEAKDAEQAVWIDRRRDVTQPESGSNPRQTGIITDPDVAAGLPVVSDGAGGVVFGGGSSGVGTVLANEATDSEGSGQQAADATASVTIGDQGTWVVYFGGSGSRTNDDFGAATGHALVVDGVVQHQVDSDFGLAEVTWIGTFATAGSGASFAVTYRFRDQASFGDNRDVGVWISAHRIA